MISFPGRRLTVSAKAAAAGEECTSVMGSHKGLWLKDQRLTAVEGDTQMFFAKRRWALRVIDGMGLPSSSPEATELVDMIIAGAKQFEEMVHSTGMRMNDAELVLMSVAAMSRNPTALNRLTQDAGLSVNEATQLLERARRAGRHLADENGYTEIVARHYDR